MKPSHLPPSFPSMKEYLIILTLFPILVFSQKADEIRSKTLTQITFGSCSKQDKIDDQLWDEVNSLESDLWIWLGDNIYGDTVDMAVMREKYDLQKSHSGYQKLIAKTEVLGIWDDHDFGVNDGGKEYPKGDESKVEMFRFLDVAKDHPARMRQGAYQSYLYQGVKNVKIILLDARYFRDPLKKDEKNWNVPNPEGEVLGDAQWSWLEKQLKDKDADFFIVGSGIQVIPEEHRFEKWANFPAERDRLLNLASTVEQPLIFISGDRHMSEASIIEHNNKRLYEFTSSSLTNPWRSPSEEPNRYREKDIVYQTNFAGMDVSWSDKTLKLEINYFGKDNEVYQTHLVTFDL